MLKTNFTLGLISKPLFSVMPSVISIHLCPTKKLNMIWKGKCSNSFRKIYFTIRNTFYNSDKYSNILCKRLTVGRPTIHSDSRLRQSLQPECGNIGAFCHFWPNMSILVMRDTLVFFLTIPAMVYI